MPPSSFTAPCDKEDTGPCRGPQGLKLLPTCGARPRAKPLSDRRSGLDKEGSGSMHQSTGAQRGTDPRNVLEEFNFKPTGSGLGRLAHLPTCREPAGTAPLRSGSGLSPP